MSELRIYGIDHGNGNMKMEHADTFPCALIKQPTEPITFNGEDVIQYKDMFYMLGKKRLALKPDKSADEDYFVLTLFALVKEATARNEKLSGKDIVLSVGLPPADFSRFAKSFKQYFLDMSKNGVSFKLNGKPVSFYVKDVVITPQNFAAVITQKAELIREYTKVNCIDIGDGTVDLLVMDEGKPDLSIRVSNKSGMKFLRDHIINGVQQNFAIQLDSRDVENVLLGKKTVLDKEVIDYINHEAEIWAKKIIQELNTHVADFRTSPVILLGGGAIILKKYLEKLESFKVVEFIDDIKANAIGYAAIAHSQLSKK